MPLDDPPLGRKPSLERRIGPLSQIRIIGNARSVRCAGRIERHCFDRGCVKTCLHVEQLRPSLEEVVSNSPSPDATIAGLNIVFAELLPVMREKNHCGEQRKLTELSHLEPTNK